MLAFVRRDRMANTVAALRTRLSALVPPPAAVADLHSFYRAWRRSPRAVGAMLPSGQALARAITRHVQAGGGAVLELGSGTGVFTRALLARGVAESDLLLVEREPQFVHALRERFPAARVLEGDAARHPQGSVWPSVQCRPAAVVCGLPLLNMDGRQQMRVMQGAFSVLQPDGALLLFTYGLRSPLRPGVLARLGLQAQKVDTVVANVPPAHVWRVTRAALTLH